MKNYRSQLVICLILAVLFIGEKSFAYSDMHIANAFFSPWEKGVVQENFSQVDTEIGQIVKIICSDEYLLKLEYTRFEEEVDMRIYQKKSHKPLKIVQSEYSNEEWSRLETYTCDYYSNIYRQKKVKLEKMNNPKRTAKNIAIWERKIEELKGFTKIYKPVIDNKKDAIRISQKELSRIFGKNGAFQLEKSYGNFEMINNKCVVVSIFNTFPKFYTSWKPNIGESRVLLGLDISSGRAVSLVFKTYSIGTTEETRTLPSKGIDTAMQMAMKYFDGKRGLDRYLLCEYPEYFLSRSDFDNFIEKKKVGDKKKITNKLFELKSNNIDLFCYKKGDSYPSYLPEEIPVDAHYSELDNYIDLKPVLRDQKVYKCSFSLKNRVLESFVPVIYIDADTGEYLFMSVESASKKSDSESEKDPFKTILSPKLRSIKPKMIKEQPQNSTQRVIDERLLEKVKKAKNKRTMIGLSEKPKRKIKW